MALCSAPCLSSYGIAASPADASHSAYTRSSVAPKIPCLARGLPTMPSNSLASLPLRRLDDGLVGLPTCVCVRLCGRSIPASRSRSGTGGFHVPETEACSAFDLIALAASLLGWSSTSADSSQYALTATLMDPAHRSTMALSRLCRCGLYATYRLHSWLRYFSTALELSVYSLLHM